MEYLRGGVLPRRCWHHSDGPVKAHAGAALRGWNFEDRSSADRAADALRTAWRDPGAPEDAVRLFHAEDASEAIRRTEGFYRPAKRAVAAFSRGVGSEEGVADQDYQTAVSQGHNVLAVLAPTPEAVERARAVLADFDVRHLRYYGPLTVTDFRTEPE